VTSIINDTWTFDGSTWHEVSANSPPVARRGAAMAALGGDALMFGGFNGLTRLGDTWKFDGSTWIVQANQATPPPPRDYASMATLNGSAVLFGGVLHGILDLDAGSMYEGNDTWIFDGAQWSEKTVANPPPIRDSASMATLGGRIVLFGGIMVSPPATVVVYDDTWAFDGSSWTQLTVASPPPARSSASLAALGNQLVLFGGQDTQGNPLNDTWLFDGTNWSSATALTAPGARYDASVAAIGGKLILFGGCSASDSSGNCTTQPTDLWSFDGATWTELSSSITVRSRDGASMVALH
jgi:N-acetylneuraminic acid mutarotase